MPHEDSMNASARIRADYTNKDQESLISLRVYINKKRFFIPLDIYVKPDAFDQKNQKVTKGVWKHQYTKLIQESIGRAADIFLKYNVNKKELTKELFLKEYNNPTSLTDFHDFMEEQIKIRDGAEVGKTTVRQHRAILSKMRAYRDSLPMSELNEEYLVNFQKHLRYKLNNKQNTINNALKVIRIYVNRAMRQELMHKYPFQYIKIKKVKTYPEFLEVDEIKELIRLYKNDELTIKLRRVLRWFLFACQTGLRISDLRAVMHENVKNGMLSYHPIKTVNVNNNRVDVPLNNLAKELISDESPKRIKGLLFDCYSEAKMNEYIKDVMDYAGIKKNVSFHNARHTFATMFLKKSTQANGIILLQRMLGHSSVETTMVYSHVLNQDLRDAMKDYEF